MRGLLQLKLAVEHENPKPNPIHQNEQAEVNRIKNRE